MKRPHKLDKTTKPTQETREAWNNLTAYLEGCQFFGGVTAAFCDWVDACDAEASIASDLDQQRSSGEDERKLLLIDETIRSRENSVPEYFTAYQTICLLIDDIVSTLPKGQSVSGLVPQLLDLKYAVIKRETKAWEDRVYRANHPETWGEKKSKTSYKAHGVFTPPFSLLHKQRSFCILHLFRCPLSITFQ